MECSSPALCTVKKATRQRGMASIVFIVLVSLAITTSAVSVLHTFRGSESITIAANAITHAQNGAWLGSEAFRRHLETLNTSEVMALNNDDHTITFSDTSIGQVTVHNINAAAHTDGTTRLTADIENIHPSAKTSHALRMVYSHSNTTGSGGSGGGYMDITPTFGGDLEIDGGITLIEENKPAILRVDGDVTVTGTSLKEIHEIKATGDVTLGSQAKATTIHANGDVTLGGSASAEIVQTTESFTITGGGYAKNVFANGDITYNASGASDVISSRSDVSFHGGTNGSHGDVLAGGEINILQSGGFNKVEAIGDISFNAWRHFGTVRSMGDISCTSKTWSDTTLVSANGSLKSAKCATSNPVFLSGQSNVITAPPEIAAYTHAATSVDVWTRKDDANYFIEYDSTVNEIKVTVNHVNGVADGSVFYIGDYQNTIDGKPYKDYLCTSVTNGYCDSPSTPLLPLCIGWSPWNNCISHQTSNGDDKFTLEPGFTAPGVMLFDGAVKLSSGYGMNTILATGNIETAGQMRLWAPNFGAYSKMCEGEGSHLSGAVKTRYEETFSVHYLTNFCDTGTNTYVASSLGNVALASGGYELASPTTYEGGFIDLGQNTVIVGAVLAGDVLKTSGDVDINGMVMSAGNGTMTQPNELSGKTTIDFTSDTYYKTDEVPNLSSTPPPATTPAATVLWVRNL